MRWRSGWSTDLAAFVLLFSSIVYFWGLDLLLSERSSVPIVNPPYPPLDLGALGATLFASLLPVALFPLTVQKLRGKPERVPFGIGYGAASAAYVLAFLYLGHVESITLLDWILDGLVIVVFVCGLWAVALMLRGKKE
ncbi:MAG: hypothetical protein ACLPY5_06345 [Candidatus Bathyarchaeia archaeon]